MQLWAGMNSIYVVMQKLSVQVILIGLYQVPLAVIVLARKYLFSLLKRQVPNHRG
jgi:hypothetical protein